MNIAITILLIVVVMLAIRLSVCKYKPLCKRKQIVIAISILLGTISITVIQFINNSDDIINITNIFVTLIWATIVKDIIDDDDDTPNSLQLI